MRILPQVRYERGYTDPWESLERVRFETNGPAPFTRDVGVRCHDVFPRPRAPSVQSAQGFGLHGAQERVVVLGDRAKISHRTRVRTSDDHEPSNDTFCRPQIVTSSPQPCQSHDRQVSARTATLAPEPLTRERVALHAAKSVWQAIEDSGGCWTLQDGTTVVYEDIVLLELGKVGEGSHQLVLAYFERNMVSVCCAREYH